MSDKNEKVEIPQNIRTMSDVFAKELTIDKNTGVATIGEEAYTNSLALSGLDAETVKKVQKHHGEAVSAQGLALGEAAIDVLAKNKGLEKVTLTTNFGRDAVVQTIKRDKEYPDVGGGDPVHKYGVLNTNYTSFGSENKGVLKKVRKHLNQLGEDKLG